jgi:hypothetical protein
MRAALATALTAAGMAAVGISTPATAADVEWRVLGPAFSHHSNSSLAPAVGTQLSASRCSVAPWAGWLPEELSINETNFQMYRRLSDVGRDLQALPDCRALEKTGPYGDVLGATVGECVDRLAYSLDIRTPQGSQSIPVYNAQECAVTVESKRRAWHEQHLALGLERVTRYDGYANRVYGQMVQDSYGTWSVMVGAGRTWPIASAGTFTVSAGVSGGLWWRTVVDRDDDREDRLRRAVVPYAMPVLAIEESYTGLGIYLAGAPGFSVSGYGMPSTVMLQTSMRIASKRAGAPRAELALGPGRFTLGIRGVF